ncbi:hypothetical protein J6S37_02335 [Candidatus Saccharibacteria bacterium]|nr:hypothetical protein [Candidatus Saccharibacteria bacterium]
MNRSKMYFLLPAGLFSLTLASGLFLTSSNINAETATANASVIVPAACTFSSALDSAHSAEINNNTYRTDIGTTTFNIICNDTEGFSLYAVGYANEEFGNTKLLATIGGVLTPAKDIVTGTAESGSTSNWAMKLKTISGQASPTIESGFSTYHSVPNTYTKVATLTNATSTSGVSVQSTYAAFISGTQPAGTYNGKVKYTMVHPANETPLQPQTATSGCINYFPNGSGVVGTMGCQSITSSATSATLLASNFSREGYGFAGWSNKYDYATNPNQEGIKFYGPQEDITFTAGQYTGTNNGLSLYAVWVKSQGSLQDSSKVATLCGTGAGSLTIAPTNGTANLASVSALTDERDNQTYAIAKLADGKCWMIENLRLESTNSDNSTGALAQGYGTSATYGNFSGLATAESANFSDSTTANSLYYSGTQDGTASIDIGTTNYPVYRMPRYNNANTSARASSPTVNTGAMYSYGNYYTWHAAIADTTAYTSNNTSVTNTSLCPAGWHLPKGGNKSNEANNDFWSLIVTGINGGTNPANYESSTEPYYTGSPEGSDASKAIRAYPNNFLYSGIFYTSSAYYRGSYGFYWSSTAYNYGLSYYLLLRSSRVSPGTDYNNYKYIGGSIRCTTGT